jgi:hypothetical protein
MRRDDLIGAGALPLIVRENLRERYAVRPPVVVELLAVRSLLELRPDRGTAEEGDLEPRVFCPPQVRDEARTVIRGEVGSGARWASPSLRP